MFTELLLINTYHHLDRIRDQFLSYPGFLRPGNHFVALMPVFLFHIPSLCQHKWVASVSLFVTLKRPCHSLHFHIALSFLFSLNLHIGVWCFGEAVCYFAM